MRLKNQINKTCLSENNNLGIENLQQSRLKCVIERFDYFINEIHEKLRWNNYIGKYLIDLGSFNTMLIDISVTSQSMNNKNTNYTNNYVIMPWI